MTTEPRSAVSRTIARIAFTGRSDGPRFDLDPMEDGRIRASIHTPNRDGEVSYVSTRDGLVSIDEAVLDREQALGLANAIRAHYAAELGEEAGHVHHPSNRYPPTPT